MLQQEAVASCAQLQVVSPGAAQSGAEKTTLVVEPKASPNIVSKVAAKRIIEIQTCTSTQR
ncbi:hypothetical protein M4951_22445 [Blastopirellula sp. J2-11]|uniref:hypothetical protein n=1 Tax=Blastopirellula sp. J2-11 TaxID=2943192 RepID=UPI0021C6FC0C|nr:hypothetical protein [Blastopirellula sp. J2-11]UUO06107.1 hypothetical protein M4951_22445 [Blastopirellula sp. J2-11]